MVIYFIYSSVYMSISEIWFLDNGRFWLQQTVSLKHVRMKWWNNVLKNHLHFLCWLLSSYIFFYYVYNFGWICCIFSTNGGLSQLAWLVHMCFRGWFLEHGWKENRSKLFLLLFCSSIYIREIFCFQMIFWDDLTKFKHLCSRKRSLLLFSVLVITTGFQGNRDVTTATLTSWIFTIFLCLSICDL